MHDKIQTLSQLRNTLKGLFSYCSNFYDLLLLFTGFPHGLAARESTCNAGDPGSILRSGRSHGEGMGYPLQYS